MWPITNHKTKNDFLWTTFMCLDIEVCLKNYVFITLTTFEMIAFCYKKKRKKWLLLTTKQEQQIEGRVPTSTSDKMYQQFEEGKIYHIKYFNFLPNNQRYKLTVHPYKININETTTITQVQENKPPIPSYIFHPQHYIQLISLASATNFLPNTTSSWSA